MDITVIYDFTATPMYRIIEILKADKSDLLTFHVLNPDLASGLYAGETIEWKGHHYIHHSLKAWSSLAELLGYRMLIPKTEPEYIVSIRYQKLQIASSFHADHADDITEKYGDHSIFSRINKLEEPTFVWHYLHALRAVKVAQRKSILNLGINKGYEFLGIRHILSPEKFLSIPMIGVDHSVSAIKRAHSILPYPNIVLHCHDINDLHSLNLFRQDLIISISTLQSPAINTKVIVMELVQKYLSRDGALILGFPNARWSDGELIHGARAPNYPYPEMSLLIKDIYWIKKYLQQHKFRVTITGKEYLFVTATKIGQK